MGFFINLCLKNFLKCFHSMNSNTNGKHYLLAINVLFQAASSLARKHSLKLCLYTEVSGGHPKVSGAAC